MDGRGPGRGYPEESPRWRMRVTPDGVMPAASAIVAIVAPFWRAVRIAWLRRAGTVRACSDKAVTLDRTVFGTGVVLISRDATHSD